VFHVAIPVEVIDWQASLKCQLFPACCTAGQMSIYSCVKTIFRFS
jgi:hypothetical protein